MRGSSKKYYDAMPKKALYFLVQAAKNITRMMKHYLKKQRRLRQAEKEEAA